MWRKPRRGIAREQLDRRRLSEADIRPAHVVRPGPGFGLWVVHDTHNNQELIVSAGAVERSLRPEETVLLGSNSGQGGHAIVSAAPVGHLGTAEFSFPSLVGARKDALGLVEADPNTLAAGSIATVVTFTGYGLNEDPLDNYRAVVYNETTKVWDDDPLITLGAVTWVSATEVTIPVTVSATAPAGHEIRLEVTRA